MRGMFAALCVLVVAMMGYAVSGTSAQSVVGNIRISPGDRVRLFYSGESPTSCTVAEIRGDFVSCRPENVDPFMRRPDRERWYNTRMVTAFERVLSEQ